jgi:type I restriction enzyme S subunit
MQNGKHSIATGLRDGFGFGTTEFHIIRPRSELDRDWLHMFVRRKEFLTEIADRMTGAVGQQRIPPQVLEQLEIPIPPIAEQRRVVRGLQDTQEAIEVACGFSRSQLAKIDALETTLLRAAFSGAL